MKISAYECTVVGRDWHQIINHASAGKAKADYLRDVRDAWPDVAFTDIRCRRVGAPMNPTGFDHVAKMRGVSFNCGDRVRVVEHGFDQYGVILGHNSSANFDVLFDSGLTLNCHPAGIRVSA